MIVSYEICDKYFLDYAIKMKHKSSYSINSVVEVACKDLDVRGNGFCIINDLVISVPQLLPGEVALVKIISKSFKVEPSTNLTNNQVWEINEKLTM